MGPRYADAGVSSGRPVRPTTPAKILVVDDDRAISRTMEVNLRARGYDVLLAADGRHALALAARGHPDIVVLDLGLPDMDGLTAIDGVRGWTSMPIIVLSARTTELEKVAALDAAANDYMTKPFGIAEFMARLRVLLRARRQADEVPMVRTADFELDLGGAGRAATMVTFISRRSSGGSCTFSQATRVVWSRTRYCSSRCGASGTRRTTTCACTSRQYGASSNLTPGTLGTFSPSRAQASVSTRGSPRPQTWPGPRQTTRTERGARSWRPSPHTKLAQCGLRTSRARHSEGSIFTES